MVVKPVGLQVDSINAINTTTTDDISVKVESGATIVVNFSDAIDTTTATSDNFVLKTGTTTVAADITYSVDKKSVSIKPVSPMTTGGSYSFTVSKDVKAADGTTLGTAVARTFTIADSLSIQSVKVGGTVLASYENTGGPLVITFNKDLSETTVNTSTFKMYNETTKEFLPLVTADIVFTTTKSVTITPPAANYLTGNTYSLKIDGVKSLDDKTLSGYTKTYGYATKVNVAPTVTAAPTGHTGLYPGVTSKMIAYTTGGGNVPAAMVLASPIKAQVAFGRAMDATTLTADNFYIAEADALGNEVAGTKVAGTVTYDAGSYSASFVPTSDLKQVQKYVVIINTSVKDSAGVPSEAQKVGFTTDDFTAPTVTSSSTDAGTRVDYNQDIVIHFSKKMDGAQMATIAAGAGQKAFTATESVRIYDQTGNATIAPTLDKSYVADATDPRLVIKAPAAGWTLNNVYQVVLNGYTTGETTMPLSDAKVAGVKTHGNMLAGDYTATFTTVAQSLPSTTGATVMKVTDGAAATNPTTALSRTDMTYNVQNAGTAGANNIMKITFNKNMKLANLDDGDLEFWYDDGTGGGIADNGVFEADEKIDIPAAQFTAISTDKKTITWTPTAAQLARLKAGDHQGRLVVTYTTTDESGQDIGTTSAADVSYLLTTGFGPAYAAPTDTTGGIVAPVKYATGVLTSQVIEVKFNQSITQH